MTNWNIVQRTIQGKNVPPGSHYCRIKTIGLCLVLTIILPLPVYSWTFSDWNLCRYFREQNIFSLTRSNPIGVRLMIIPVIDDPLNAPVYTRLSVEFTTQLRSFADDVLLVTDLPDNAIKSGFYTTLPYILADYRLKNKLSMDLIHKSMPDFECDFIALFEVTAYDRYWVDEDLMYRVAVRSVLYDYDDGSPRLEKYFAGGRGMRYEEGAFNEAERFAIKGLVVELEKPLREAVNRKKEELEKKYSEIYMLANNVGQRELAVHQHDLGIVKNQVERAQAEAEMARKESQDLRKEVDYWKQEAARPQPPTPPSTKEKPSLYHENDVLQPMPSIQTSQRGPAGLSPSAPGPTISTNQGPLVSMQAPVAAPAQMVPTSPVPQAWEKTDFDSLLENSGKDWVPVGTESSPTPPR